jgi:hypothetical protein
MKIDLNAIDTSQFMMHPHVLNNETVWLIQPQFIGCKWTQANKHLRSSVWNSEGELVSASFSKFTNWGENPENFPVPSSLKDTTIVEKLDGSTLIVSKYKGNVILRTRGTVDATVLDNGYELEEFKNNHLVRLLTNDKSNTWDYSYLFEWVSPINRIILNYGDTPKWFLIGGVEHKDYSLWSQVGLDNVAHEFGFERPPSYTFPSIEDLIKNVEQWRGKEGVVIYSNNDQTLHKVKGLWYLALHRMKEALASFDKVVDCWYEQGEPSYQKFEEFIINQFDYELWTQIRGDASRICDGYKKVNQIVIGMHEFVNETLKPLPNRKEQALKVLSAYGNTNRASFVFKLLDGKPLEKDDKKKLLYQVLKK